MSARLTDQERLWRSVPESEVLKSVMIYVDLLGGYCLRLNTGAMVAEYQGRKRFIRFAEKGAPDAIAIIRGVVLFLETKTELGKQSPEQIAWQAEVERRGGRYLVCRPSNYAELIDAALEAR